MNDRLLVARRVHWLRRTYGIRGLARLFRHRPEAWNEIVNFELETFVQDQQRRFQEIGLDWGEAQGVIAAVPEDHRRRDTSEHYAIFASWLGSRPNSTVLEVGTAKGRFSGFLGSLLPQGRVITIDLPVEDLRYMNATIVADRFVGGVDRAPEERTANLALPNIRFVEMNSLMLVNSTRRFDAVWLDGDHTNPVVTLDIANALRLVRPGGLLAMDDVRLPGAWFGVRGSDETWQALESLRKAGVVTYGLVHKRLTENALLITEVRKYIAVVTRVSDRNPLDLGDEDPHR